MKYIKVHFHGAPGAIRSFFWSLFLSGSLLAGTLGIVPSAFGATITDGTYIAGSYYDGGNAVGSYTTSGGFNYTNGTLSQTNTTSDPASPFGSATSTASLTSDQLSMSLSGGSSTFTSGTAEMWDTLTLGNLPSGPGVTASTVLGTLNMSVNASTSNPFASASSAWGLDLYSTASFAPSAGSDCGLVAGACGGLIAQSANGSIQNNGLPLGTFAPGTSSFSVPITLGSLTSGHVAYIAEIAAESNTGALLAIDPSITLTGLYSGVTVASDSGNNYVTAVPEPTSAWLFGSGLLGLLGVSRARRRG
ncbi:MAG: PEP-CTERM sorting domain-containing protein [Acidiferrobacteraceae bacterium]